MTAVRKLPQEDPMLASRRPAPESDVPEDEDGWEEEIDRRIADARAGRGGAALTLEELDAQTRAKFGWAG